MKLYFVITTLIILLFGFSVSAYVTNYKLKLANSWSQILVTLILGLAISLIVFVFAVIAIWP